MESVSGELIRRWLEKVSEGPPPEPQCDHLNTTDLEPNGGLPIALEPTDTGPAIRWPRINKRPREEDPDSGQQIHQKRTGDQYQKRPRRKTREDKYEYKRPESSQRTARSHKDKAKRTRTIRKHTINDAFHASNVARERLTLQDPMKMGIFSRGKASSPIKLRDVHDPSFSETRFLARQDRELRGTTGSALGESPLQQKLGGQHEQRPRTSHYVFREPPKLLHNEQPLLDHEELPMHTSREYQSRPSVSQGVFLSPSAAVCAAQDSVRVHSELPPHSVHESQSPTPYSWSVSDRLGSQQSREVEDRLLKILHTGLSPRQPSDPSDRGGPSSGYCTIQDLKSLLKSRKAFWQTQMSLGLHSVDGVTTRIENREPEVMVTSAVQSPVITALSLLKGPEDVSDGGKMSTHYGEYLDELLRSAQRKPFHDHRSAGSKNACRSSQPPFRARFSANLVEPSAEDDFIFFQELDAAYCAILEPNGANDDSLGQIPTAKYASHRSLIRHTQREGHPSHQKRQPSFYGSIDTLLYGQPDLDVLPACPNPSRLLEEDSGAFPRNTSTTLRPSEPTSSRRLSVAGPQTLSRHQSRPAPESCSPIPPGFWRHRRLY